VFDWLFDGCWTVSVILGAAGVGCAVAWWRTRQKGYAIGFGIVVFLAGVYIVLSLLVETAKGQMERRVQDIANGVKNKQVADALSRNLSDDFSVKSKSLGTLNKKEFTRHADALRQAYGVVEIRPTQFQLEKVERSEGVAEISFSVRVSGDLGDQLYRVKAVFASQPKNHWWEKEVWLLRTFEYFNPFVDQESPLEIP
jgi:hypothetical protein